MNDTIPTNNNLENPIKNWKNRNRKSAAFPRFAGEGSSSKSSGPAAGLTAAAESIRNNAAAAEQKRIQNEAKKSANSTRRSRSHSNRNPQTPCAKRMGFEDSGS